MRDPWSAPKYRFGVVLEHKTFDGDNTAGVGWSVIELEPRQPITTGVDNISANPVEIMVRRYKELISDHPDCDGVTLYKYKPSTFRRSRPAADGLSRTEHNALVDRAAARLRAEGIDVEIKIT